MIESFCDGINIILLEYVLIFLDFKNFLDINRFFGIK